HALQDQSVDLDKWMKGRADPGPGTGEQAAPTLNEGAAAPKESEKTLEPNLEISQDEEQTARQAVVEGQGMVVMVDYLLKDSNQTAVSAPFIVEALKQSMRDSKEYPMYSNAPLYLRESLSFPYQYGMDFVREM